MFFGAQKIMNEFIVNSLREFMIEPSYYIGEIPRDYSKLGEPFQDDDPSTGTLQLISTTFPEGRKRYFPNITIDVATPTFKRLSFQDLAYTKDSINNFARRETDMRVRTGHLMFRVSINIQAKDKLTCEEISDLVGIYSITYGYAQAKANSYYFGEFSGGKIVAKPLTNSQSVKIYENTITLPVQASWILGDPVEGLILSKVNIEYLS